ncbi:MAG: hypothetical protein JW860_01690 [Sedimentisphaerales bacterium]|nr:hypothetical protein [Sedimentisphaerales bacterium]
MLRLFSSRSGFILVLIILMVVTTGCSRGLKEGFYTIKGSSGDYFLIKGDKEHNEMLFEHYGGVQVEPFTSTIGQLCHPDFIPALPDAIREHLQFRPRTSGDVMKFKDKEEMGPFFTGPAGRNLLIKGQVVHYDQSGYDTKGLIQKAISPLDEVVCRVQILDETTGEMITEANCVAQAKSSVRTGPKELAQGIGKAINKWISPKLPAKEEEKKD